MRWLHSITISVGMNMIKLQEMTVEGRRADVLHSMGSQRDRHDLATKQQLPNLEGRYPLIQFCSVTQSCLTLCDPIDSITPVLPVHHKLPEFTQTHVHQVSDATQPSHLLSSPSPPAFIFPSIKILYNESALFKPVAKVLEFQLQHQSFQ